MCKAATTPQDIHISDFSSLPRKPLVDDAGLLKTLYIMAYSHLSVTFLCLNVMFDLFVLGVPALILHALGILSDKNFTRYTTVLIDWTTPIVCAAPVVFSGTQLYCNDINLLIESKEKNSLFLANHGSRIDWMIAMVCGHMKDLVSKTVTRCRVGFVCEAIIQYMPFIGWYRKMICDDVFVSRSFQADGPIIKKNISHFHRSGCTRMLFLSPEGVVVDFGKRDVEYIKECREFCKEQGYRPFEYTLTPRYKGTTCLLKQTEAGGPVVSVTLAYIRDGKLLNCRLTSPNRVIPDIYLLHQGIGGKPVHVYIHLERLDISTTNVPDLKKVLMTDYERKDKMLSMWDKFMLGEQQTQSAEKASWMSQFTAIDMNVKSALLYQLLHAIVMFAAASLCGCMDKLLLSIKILFVTVASCHTLGWVMNSTSMESVPFETGIKGIYKATTGMKRTNCLDKCKSK